MGRIAVQQAIRKNVFQCPFCQKKGLIAVQQAIRKNVFRCEYCLLNCLKIDEKYYYDDNSNFLEEINNE